MDINRSRNGVIKVCVAGATGRVGSGVVRAIANSDDLELVGAVARSRAGEDLGTVLGIALPRVTITPRVEDALSNKTDVLVDFTSAKAVKANVLTAIECGVHVVIGSSGLSDLDYHEIDHAAQTDGVGVFAAGNYALTAVLLQRLATIAARHIPHWEIIDFGSATKPDAPSGTAFELSNRLAQVRTPELAIRVADTVGNVACRGGTVNGMQLHSLRLPGFLSGVEVTFGLAGERLTLRHESTDATEPYVSGVMLAIRRVQALKGLLRGLDSLLGLD